MECHFKGGLKAGHLALIVHVLPKGSQVNYYQRSHLHELSTKEGGRGLYENDALEIAGFEAWTAGDQKLTEGGKYGTPSYDNHIYLTCL